jgi:proteasome lid subunit RPN8/RPN11
VNIELLTPGESAQDREVAGMPTDDGFSDLEIELGTARQAVPRRPAPPKRGLLTQALFPHDPAGDGDQLIFVAQSAWDGLRQHALSRRDIEIGGVLLGTYALEGEQFYLEVNASFDARYTEESAASLTFTHRTWTDFNQRKAREYPESKIVGWYHTHPGYGIFMSSYDLFIQEHFFNQIGQVALVFDPVKDAAGFFYWNGATTIRTYKVYQFDNLSKRGKTIREPEQGRKDDAVQRELLEDQKEQPKIFKLDIRI